MNINFHPLGDQAVILELGEEITIPIHEKVKQVANFFEQASPEWVIEYIPSFTTVTVIYHPVMVMKQEGQKASPFTLVCEKLQFLLSQWTAGETTPSRTVEIPVCYGGECGPDLDIVANHTKLSTEEVIDIHSSGDYLVYMIGFAPGFPYIGGMSDKIATPRKASPRLKIPAGSIGIAGNQTGIYPLETPGGWQLIGRTPLQLFLPDEHIPSLLRAGDKIKFSAISYEEYQQRVSEQC